jgi:hypothetical protein
MVKAIVDLDERTNRVVNIVKAKYGLKDKSEAIGRMVQEYEKMLLEPALRPEFIKKMEKRQREKIVKVTDFKKRYGL